jgi:hypothetical protein
MKSGEIVPPRNQESAVTTLTAPSNLAVLRMTSLVVSHKRVLSSRRHCGSTRGANVRNNWTVHNVALLSAGSAFSSHCAGSSFCQMGGSNAKPVGVVCAECTKEGKTSTVTPAGEIVRTRTFYETHLDAKGERAPFLLLGVDGSA